MKLRFAQYDQQTLYFHYIFNQLLTHSPYFSLGTPHNFYHGTTIKTIDF